MAKLPIKLPFAERSQEKADASHAQQHEEGESLTTILSSREDRTALTLLVANCIQRMRQSLLDIFDAQKTATEVDLSSATATLEDLDLATDETKITRQEKLKKDLAQWERDIDTPTLQGLKKAALDFFDDWSASALQRIGEVVNLREEHDEEKKRAGPATSDRAAAASHPLTPSKAQKSSDYDEKVDKKLVAIYPPVENSLLHLPENQRTLILHSLLLLLLSLEHYHAHSRVLMLRLTTSLGLSVSFLGEDEAKVARGLLSAVENLKADDETKKKADENKTARRWKVGLAAAAGATLIGITGGLAAPLLAAGIGSVMGGLGLGATAAAGYLGTLAGSGVLVGGLFGAYGGRMTSQVMDQYAREVEDFAFEPIRSLHTQRKDEKECRRLRVGIGISGWLTKKDDVAIPWKPLGAGLESFALRWEMDALMSLGNSLSTMVRSAVWSVAKNEIIQRTVFAALTAGLWPLALVKASRLIDNPWSVASFRAQKAGEVLADALINKAQGERPVTLVGYSLGAQVIFTCLRQLADRKAFGLVESVVLIGSPLPSRSADWRMARSVVSGRVVNVYSTQDYILGFLYRSSSIQLGVAGLQAIEGVAGVENVDVSDMVKEGGHTSYRLLTGAVLKKIGFEDVDYLEMEQENRELQKEEERTQREREAAGSSETVSDEEIKGLENQVENKNK